MTYKGRLIGATFSGNGGAESSDGTNPHPTLFAHPDGQHYVVLTFDATRYPASGNTYTWGQPNVMISTP
jgi:hypothetical protein